MVDSVGPAGTGGNANDVTRESKAKSAVFRSSARMSGATSSARSCSASPVASGLAPSMVTLQPSAARTNDVSSENPGTARALGSSPPLLWLMPTPTERVSDARLPGTAEWRSSRRGSTPADTSSMRTAAPVTRASASASVRAGDAFGVDNDGAATLLSIAVSAGGAPESTAEATSPGDPDKAPPVARGEPQSAHPPTPTAATIPNHKDARTRYR